ncbi:hypothetical protein MMC08_004494 [Hypocenomyce scalaris]|nr:hypothetical protein [Hypocenomyce scalaris]
MSAGRLETVFGISSDVIDDLVLANRILAQHQVLDTFGHVSIRCNRNQEGGAGEELFLLATYGAPAQVGRDDIAIHRVSTGEPADETEKRKGPSERHIHAGIYRACTGVQAVLHCHAPVLVSFSILPPGAAELKPVVHVGASAGSKIPIYDIAHRNGDHTNLLIRTPELGDDLASSFGPTGGKEGPNMVLMRGHGATIVSPSNVRDLVHRGIYAVINAGIYKDALLMTGSTPSEIPRVLSEGEIEACGSEVNAVARSWPAWVSALGADSGIERSQR